MTPTRSAQALQDDLKAELQKEKDPAKLELLAAVLLGRFLGVTVAVANSGFQYGADAGTSGRDGRRLRIECKKYGDTTPLSERELLGEIDHALARDPALEAWVLVATREVSENIEQSLTQKGESVGVPVVIVDWKPGAVSSLAALCSTAPDIVESAFSKTAGALATALQTESADAVKQLRNELQEWHLGFEALRSRSHAVLKSIWSSPRTSNSLLGQNAAGGAEAQRVHRSSVHDAIDGWWNGVAKEDAPVAIVGRDGVGKTWATLNWLVAAQDELPIVLVLPASAAMGLSAPTESGVKRLVADGLHDIATARDRDHWLRRLDRLLMRPAEEGPALCLFFDGLKSEDRRWSWALVHQKEMNATGLRRGATMKPIEYFSTHPVFRFEEFAAAHNGGPAHPRSVAAVKQHVRAGNLVRIHRGLYAVVPRGSRPETVVVDPYVVAGHLAPDAVVAYHAALQFHGKAYSVFRRYSFLTRTRVKRFTFRGSEFVPVRVPPSLEGQPNWGGGIIERPRSGSKVRVTTLERTLVDVLDAPRHGGGWEEIWRSLESVEFFDLDAVIAYALARNSAVTVAKVGFYLEQHREQLMVEDVHLERLRAHSPAHPMYLERGKREPGKLLTTWNLVVPERVLSRAWADVA